MNIFGELKSFAKNLTVLVVEDDPLLNGELVELVSLFFKDVKSALNGEEALVIYKENSIDVVMSDITMPFMNGVELSKKIKHINDEQSIIILSANSEMSYMIDLIDIGINQFVHKPFDDQELLYRLLKVSEHVALTKENLETAEEKTEAPNALNAVKSNEEESVTNAIGHTRVDSSTFMQSLVNDELAWSSIEEDINALFDIVEDFEYYIGLLYKQHINQDILHKIASILRKMYTSLTQIEAMGNMSMIFFDLAVFLEDVKLSTLSDEKIKKFKILEFIYDDIVRFVETVFVYKDAIDIYYLEDSLKSSVEQLKQNILDLPFEEEELEFF
jgi:YesN/AraC family two-component response regulator